MKVFVWTDRDLDGAGCVLALKWLLKDKCTKFDFKSIEDRNFTGTFKGWLPAEDEYDKIFITDVQVPDELVSIVDTQKYVIIDHHKSHIDVKDRYKRAKVILKEYESATKLILDTFPNSKDIPDEVLKLADIINDYDSYQLKLPETLQLNAIFGTYTNPRVKSFVENFGNGIRPFTTYEQNAVKLYLNKLKEQLEADCFEGEIKGYKVVSCFANYAVNEVAHFMLKKHKADIAIIVNLQTKSINFRRSRTCTAKLNILAESLCDGGGHEYAAGGKVTDKFLTFTKLLKPC